MVHGLLGQGHHLVTRVRSNAVTYTVHRHRGPKKRGRPRRYGRKIALQSLLRHPHRFHSAPSPVYGEHNVTIHYQTRDLLWRPAGRLVRFVAVRHPERGACLPMCTDVSLSPIEIIRLYGLRFKIELSFKQAVRLIGTAPCRERLRDVAGPVQHERCRSNACRVFSSVRPSSRPSSSSHTPR